MIKDKQTIIKNTDGEKTCLSCMNQIYNYCYALNFQVASYAHNPECIFYTHYTELKEVK